LFKYIFLKEAKTVEPINVPQFRQSAAHESSTGWWLSLYVGLWNCTLFMSFNSSRRE